MKSFFLPTCAGGKIPLGVPVCERKRVRAVPRLKLKKMLVIFLNRDLGAYRFRRGRGGRISGRWRLATIKRAIKN